jgi:DmX-like protein
MCITIYQAVFDARTLLQDMKFPMRQDSTTGERNDINLEPSLSVISSVSNVTEIPYDSFNVVSVQSTARPGCIIELDKVASSNENWTKADLFHVYQEGIVRNIIRDRPTSSETGIEPQFDESYFLILLEKKKTSISIDEIVHMWKINIKSSNMNNPTSESNTKSSNENKNNDDSFILSNSAETTIYESLNHSDIGDNNTYSNKKNRLTITSTRVCRQKLELPPDVEVMCANSAAADLSSSAMFTLKKVPYLFATACSDDIVRFWSCKEEEEALSGNNNQITNFTFYEWELNSTLGVSSSVKDNDNILTRQDSKTSSLSPEKVLSQVKLKNSDSIPLAISCSYNGRFAVAYKLKSTAKEHDHLDQTQPTAYNNSSKIFENFCVRIYECESTGGSAWKLEDCIHLKNIVLPEIDSGINFDYIFGKQKPIRPSRSMQSFKNIAFQQNNNTQSSTSSGNASISGSTSNSTQNMSQMSNTSMNVSNINSSLNNTSINEFIVNGMISSSQKSVEIPSTAAKITIKRQFSNKNRNSADYGQPLTMNESQIAKNIIKLDWASTENGSHILTIGLGNQVFVYSCVTRETSIRDKKTKHENKNNSTVKKMGILYDPINNNNKTLSTDDLKGRISASNFHRLLSTTANELEDDCHSDSSNSLVKWLLVRSFELDSADDMQALPTKMKWVREGLMVVCLNTEMQVYSQWSKYDIHKSTTKEHIQQHKMQSSSSNSIINDTKSSLKVPKNHSVLDLNKLSKQTAMHTKKHHTTAHRRISANDRKESFESTNKPQLDKNSFPENQIKGNLIFDENLMLEVIQDMGLFMQAKHAWPVLPLFHPKILLELMNSGKINRVKAILMHLIRCIIDCENNQRSKIDAQKKVKKMSRKMSICNEKEIPEEHPLNYLKIESIPPLPLFALFAADNDNHELTNSKSEENMRKNSKTENDYDAFDITKTPKKKTALDDELLNDEYRISFEDNVMDDDDEDEKQRKLDEKQFREKEELKKLLLDNSNNNASSFNSKVCQLFIEYLSNVKLCSLSSIDQMYLIAFADTVANIDCDVSFNQTENLFSKHEHKLNKQATFVGEPQESTTGNLAKNPIVDNCGLKFLLALRCYNYLSRTLPASNRNKLKDVGLGTANYVWAFHSECQQELLNAIPQISSSAADDQMTSSMNSDFRNKNNNKHITWADLRQYGIGWWLKNATLLRQIIERVAKNAFQEKNDPLDAAIYYLAMRKKGVLWGLFKTCKDTRMTEFFKNDFNDKKWQSAAKKNAFVLLGKQRFEQAAAFFLLAGRLRDAIEVCVRSLNDIQLAIIIIRLYANDFDQANLYLKTLLSVEILGYSIDKSAEVDGVPYNTVLLPGPPDQSKISNDPFLRSISFWFINDYQEALHTLYDVELGWKQSEGFAQSNKLENKDLKAPNYSGIGTGHDSIISHVFNFYTFLKNHPLVLRQQILKGNEIEDINKIETISPKKTATSKKVPLGKSGRSSSVAVFEINMTPIERRLHFIAAYYHLINGCPLISLDVLSRLPKYVNFPEKLPNIRETSETVTSPKPSKITFQSDNNDRADAFDWSSNSTVDKKVDVNEKADAFDWSTPLNTGRGQFDNDDELVLDDFNASSDDEDENNNNENKDKDDEKDETITSTNGINNESDHNNNQNYLLTLHLAKAKEIEALKKNRNKTVDAFAQQIKYIACLKILIEELSTLATGFEVFGGQLRYYMYYWLERETQIVRELNDSDDKGGSINYNENGNLNNTDILNDEEPLLTSLETSNLDDTMINGQQTSLFHQQILKDQKKFQDKIQRLNRRKEWLRSNELLLRTFLSYCSLHSSSSGLTSVKMELVLLLQELAEDRSMKQLFSPVPVQTTIPLLSASIASSKNVIAGPIRMLKSLSSDILSTIANIIQTPSIFDSSIIILTVKESSVSLSSCIYQCLCDSDAFIVSNSDVDTGMQGFSRNIFYKSTYLMSGMRRQLHVQPGETGENRKRDLNPISENSEINDSASIKNRKVNTEAKNWPGVSDLTQLLEREQDVEAPKLKVLLFESLVAVFSSLLINAFVFYDSSTLWRLLSQSWDNEMWNRLFGGGCITEYKYKTTVQPIQNDENSKQRMKLNAQLGHYRVSSDNQMNNSVNNTSGGTTSGNVEEKSYIRERFLPPEINMINYFMTKNKNTKKFEIDHTDGYDSDDDQINQDHSNKDLDDMESEESKSNAEHMNPTSYSWCLIRYAILQYSIYNITSFLSIIGIEKTDLAILSPLIHEILKAFERWSEILEISLVAFNGVPDNYIPGCNSNNFQSTSTTPKILKYQSMLDPANTPFM